MTAVTSAVLAVGFLVGTLVGQAAGAAPGASVNVALVNATTGTAPFDATPGPGNDVSPSDSTVRTNDAITYLVDLQAVGRAINETVSLTLADANASWVVLPPQCLPDGSSIKGLVLTCNTGDHRNAVFSISPSVLVSGAAANGAQITVTPAVTADNAIPVTSAAVTDTVSALPRFDLTKSFGTPKITGTTLNGQIGFMVAFPVTLQAPPGRGIENVTGPLTFTDDLSHLFVGRPVGSGHARVVGCGPNGAGGVTISDIPGGAGGAVNAVTNSGSWTCPQTGNTVSVTITGADLTLTHMPTANAGGGALPANTAIAVSGYISVFVPVADLSYAPGNTQALLHNQLTGFAPNSISGQPNYGPGNHEPGFDGTGNNAVNTSVPTGASGGFSTEYGNIRGGPSYDLVAPNGSVQHDGNGVVTPGQNYTGIIQAANRGALPITDLTLCDLVDNNVNTVTGNNAVHVNAGTVTGVTFEYAAGPPISTPGQQQAGTCTSADGPWFSSIAQVPGGAKAVTKVRAVVPNLPLGAYIVVYFGLQAVPTLPNGTYLRNFASVHAPDVNGGAPINDSASAADANGGMADHLLGVTAIARVRKATINAGDDPKNPSDTVRTLQPGATVDFDLIPSLTAATRSTATYPYTVTDTLPAGLTYQAGSASIPPANVTSNPDGSSTLLFDLGTVPPGTVISPITYKVTVTDVMPTPGLTNTVVVASPADTSPTSVRTATRAVAVTGAEGLAVSKQVAEAQIYPGQTVHYTLNIGNTTATAIPSTDIIDVLPFNGDGRSPNSSFHGSQALDAVTPSYPGAVITYTRAAPATVDLDPAAASNGPGGATAWCATAEFGTSGCPASLAEVTAVRVQDSTPFPASSERSIALSVKTAGNTTGDQYTNRFESRTPTLGFPATSNDVSVPVVAPAIGITKQVCTHTTAAACDITVDADWASTQEVPVGSTAYWRITVTNSGTLPLTNVYVTDQLTGGKSGSEPSCMHTFSGTLQPSASENFGCATANIQSATTNSAVAYGTGQVVNGATMAADSSPASADVTVDGYLPTITTKTSAVTGSPGQLLTDSVALTGVPKGFEATLTWALLGPVPARSNSCVGVNWTGAPTVASGTIITTGTTPSTTPGVIAPDPGCYTYTEQLAATARNPAAVSVPGLPGETTLIGPAAPAMSTEVNARHAHPGDPIADTVTITGTKGYAATVSWQLLGPVAATNGTCANLNYRGAKVVASGTIRITGDGTVSTPRTTVSAVGCYTYTETLSGTDLATATSVAGQESETALVTSLPTTPLTIDAPLAPPTAASTPHLAYTGVSVVQGIIAGLVVAVGGILLLVSVGTRRRTRQ